MIVAKTQKTTTVFAFTLDNADLQDLIAKSLRSKVGVLDTDEGVTVSVAMVPDADGAVGAVVNLAVETIDQPSPAPTPGDAPVDAAPPAVDAPAAPVVPAPLAPPVMQFPKAA